MEYLTELRKRVDKDGDGARLTPQEWRDHTLEEIRVSLERLERRPGVVDEMSI